MLHLVGTAGLLIYMTLSQHARHRHSEIDSEKENGAFFLLKSMYFNIFFRVFCRLHHTTTGEGVGGEGDLFVLEEMVRSAVHVHVSGEVRCAAGKGHNSN
jgi:hypothetical protein